MQLKAILCKTSTKKQLRNAYYKITPNLLFKYQCTSGKFIRLPNRIEKIDSVARIESNRNFFCPNWNALEHTASFLCMDNKHGGKLFVIKQSKVRRLTAKCTKNAAASDTSNECVRDWLSFVCVAYMTY